MMLLAIQTGVRVSELVNLTIAQATLTNGAHVRVIGKGNKERCAILTNETAAVLRGWLRERQGQPHQPLFPTRRGEPLTTRAFELRLDKHTATSALRCPTLRTKRITPHTLRHTNAMLLRAENVDIYTIALWLGHYVGDPVKGLGSGRRDGRRASGVEQPRGGGSGRLFVQSVE
jgi:site-specific recombinase XerD